MADSEKPEKIQFVPAKNDADFKLIRQLAEKIWPGVYEQILSPEQISHMMEMMYALPVMRRELAEGVRFFLVMDGPDAVGFLSWGPYEGKEAKLHKLYLLESARGRGIGRKMLNFACREAAMRGFEMLRLNVNRHNASSVAVYRACGFRELARVDVPIGNGFYMNDFIMGKELKIN